MGKRRLDPVRLAVAPLLGCLTDERLLDLARAGHEQAFEAIVERYRRPLLRYCQRLLPQSRAEDAVQQTFLGTYRAIRDGERILQLRPWLYRAAHNAAVDALRQNGWDNEPIERGSNGAERADEAWQSREDLRDLVASLQALPRCQREAIVLRELEGFGHEEIAAMLGLSESAARQAIHRARSALRAGVSALAPPGLLESLSAGALAKLGAAGAVAGALALGGAQAPVPSGEWVKHRLAGPQTASALPTQSGREVTNVPPAADASANVPAAVEDESEADRDEIGQEEGSQRTTPEPDVEAVDGPVPAELPNAEDEPEEDEQFKAMDDEAAAYEGDDEDEDDDGEEDDEDEDDEEDDDEDDEDEDDEDEDDLND